MKNLLFLMLGMLIFFSIVKIEDSLATQEQPLTAQVSELDSAAVAAVSDVQDIDVLELADSLSIAFHAPATQEQPLTVQVIELDSAAVAAVSDVQEIEVPELADSLSIAFHAPASLEIANHQTEKAPFPAVRKKSFMDGGEPDFLLSISNQKQAPPGTMQLLVC